MKTKYYIAYYLDEIKRVAKKDGIECKIVAAYTQFKAYQNEEHRWDVPGVKIINTLSVFNADVKIHIQGSMTI